MENNKSLEELLNDWGFSEYEKKFQDFGLDGTTVIHLDSSQIESIFGKKQYDKIIRFKLCLKLYKEENVRITCFILFVIMSNYIKF